MRGSGGWGLRVSANEYFSCAHGAQKINFGDLTSYLTYVCTWAALVTPASSRLICRSSSSLQPNRYVQCTYLQTVLETKFFDVIGTKVSRVFFPLAIHSHLYKRILPPPPFLPPSKSGSKVWNWFAIQTLNMETSSLRILKIMPRNLKRNCTFMNSAFGHVWFCWW